MKEARLYPDGSVCRLSGERTHGSGAHGWQGLAAKRQHRAASQGDRVLPPRIATVSAAGSSGYVSSHRLHAPHSASMKGASLKESRRTVTGKTASLRPPFCFYPHVFQYGGKRPTPPLLHACLLRAALGHVASVTAAQCPTRDLSH